MKLGLSSIFGSAKATQEADNVVILQKVEDVESGGPTRKYLDVRKNRYDGELGSVQLFFNAGAQLFYEASGNQGRKRSMKRAATETKVSSSGEEDERSARPSSTASATSADTGTVEILMS